MKCGYFPLFCLALLWSATGCSSDTESSNRPGASVPSDASVDALSADGSPVDVLPADALAPDVKDASPADGPEDALVDVVFEGMVEASEEAEGGKIEWGDREIGIRYHSLQGSPSLFPATFINDYHVGDNRDVAISHMQAMIDQGVTVIHTTIWPTGWPSASWGSHFPLSQQEYANLATLVQDVRDLRSIKGHAPRLHLSLLDGADSQFKTQQVNNSFPMAAGGSRDGSQFLEAWKQSIHGIIDTVEPIRHGDGTPVMQRLYLGGEIMLRADGSSPYDGSAGWVLQWFLKSIIPEFFSACEAADIVPNTYFFAWPITEAKIMDGSWLDIVDESLQWWKAELPAYIPERIDLSVYTGDHSIPDYTSNQRARILATAKGMDQLMKKHFGAGGRSYAFVEAHYYHVEADHPLARKEAFNTYRDMMDPAHADHHPFFEGVHVWPYPYSIQGGANVNGASPPYDLSDMVD